MAHGIYIKFYQSLFWYCLCHELPLDSWDLFTNILQGWYTGMVHIRLPRNKWNDPEGPGKILNMMTSSNGNIFCVTGHLCGEFIYRWQFTCFMMTSWNRKFSMLLAICVENSSVTGEFTAQRPVTRSFDVFFDLRLNKRLSKQPWGWWFETPSCSLWRHCNDQYKNQGPFWVWVQPMTIDVTM